jgi:hypothetical protein
MNDTRHLTTDAHGRSIDLTSNGQAPLSTPAHSCTAHPQQGTPTVIILAALLFSALLLALLLIVIRDIATMLIGPSILGTALKALLARSNRRSSKA